MLKYVEYEARNGEITAEQIAKSVNAAGAEVKVRTSTNSLSDKITFAGDDVIPAHELQPRYRVSRVEDWVRVKRAG